MGSVGLANKGSCCRADIWGEEEENRQALASLHETMKWWASERDEAVAASNFGALVLQAVYGKCVGNAVCQLGWTCLVLRPSPGCGLEFNVTWWRWPSYSLMVSDFIASSLYIILFGWGQLSKAWSGICMWSLCGCPLITWVYSPVDLGREGQEWYLKLPAGGIYLQDISCLQDTL